MNDGDLIDWIRDRMASAHPAALALVEPILKEARQQLGGEAHYIKLKPMKEPPKPVESPQ